MDAIVARAPAKLNLTLEIVHRLANGYHSIRSVFLRLDGLADTIRTRVDPAGRGVVIDTNSKQIPSGAANICHVAAHRYLDRVGETAHVELNIDKCIPVAAGLGGGSSDAAAVLLSLNQYFQHRLSAAALATLGSEIGKDVPFFLAGSPAAKVTSMGEVVEAIGQSPPLTFLLVNPMVAMSTAEAYREASERIWFMDHSHRADRTAAMVKALATGRPGEVAGALYNDFEPQVERSIPVIKEIKQALLAFGAMGASMTGSGPTVFGIFNQALEVLNAESALKTRYPSFMVQRCEPC